MVRFPSSFLKAQLLTMRNEKYSDVTRLSELKTTYAEICSTMPPIAGVAQGASKDQQLPPFSIFFHF